MRAQTAFDLDDEILGQAEGVQGLTERLDIALGLALLALLTFLGVETLAVFGFRVFSGISFDGGHGVFLRIDWR